MDNPTSFSDPLRRGLEKAMVRARPPVRVKRAVGVMVLLRADVP